MKRELVCPNCAKTVLRVFKYDGEMTAGKTISFDPYPEEHVKLVPGKLKGICICDQCGDFIDHDDPVYAVSIWSDYGGMPYSEWESEFLEGAT